MDHCFSVSFDVDSEDVHSLREYSETESEEWLALLLADARRKAEVNVSRLTEAEKPLIDKAKKSEVDDWVKNSVFTIAKRSGIAKNRIMAMRWVLTWKKVGPSAEHPTGQKGKARLVIKGFTDPDLLKIRAESPTLSKAARHLILQIAASHRRTLEMGDVKTAFLQGDGGEDERDVYAEPPADVKRLLGMEPGDVMKNDAICIRTS